MVAAASTFFITNPLLAAFRYSIDIPGESRSASRLPPQKVKVEDTSLTSVVVQCKPHGFRGNCVVAHAVRDGTQNVTGGLRNLTNVAMMDGTDGMQTESKPTRMGFRLAPPQLPLLAPISSQYGAFLHVPILTAKTDDEEALELGFGLYTIWYLDNKKSGNSCFPGCSNAAA